MGLPLLVIFAQTNICAIASHNAVYVIVFLEENTPAQRDRLEILASEKEEPFSL